MATPELFAEALFTDTSSWTVIDRGPFEALLPITVSVEKRCLRPRGREGGVRVDVVDVCSTALNNDELLFLWAEGARELSHNFHPVSRTNARLFWSVWWRTLTRRPRGRRSSRYVCSEYSNASFLVSLVFSLRHMHVMTVARVGLGMYGPGVIVVSTVYQLRARSVTWWQAEQSACVSELRVQVRSLQTFTTKSAFSADLVRTPST